MMLQITGLVIGHDSENRKPGIMNPSEEIQILPRTTGQLVDSEI
jgi:hypothetical protein